jgi:hypothetical protein
MHAPRQVSYMDTGYRSVDASYGKLARVMFCAGLLRVDRVTASPRPTPPPC